jgi:hypothetical protein
VRFSSRLTKLRSIFSASATKRHLHAFVGEIIAPPID